MLLPSAFGEPGRTRTRDGRFLHHVTAGRGSPTVVFEAGLGANRGTWGLVQPAVAEHTRTLAYDRAGLGRSDPAPSSLNRMATDLEDLIDADTDSSFVLVAHSLGGVLARWVAQRRPSLIAGLVLVDQVDESLSVYHNRNRARSVSVGYTIGAVAALSGLPQRLLKGQLHKDFPPAMASELTTEEISFRALRTGAGEVLAMANGLRELMADTAELPDVPVTLISAGRCGPGERRSRPLLVRTHRRFAERLPQGRHVVAERADHLVPLQQPEIIITETRRVLARRDR